MNYQKLVEKVESYMKDKKINVSNSQQCIDDLCRIAVDVISDAINCGALDKKVELGNIALDISEVKINGFDFLVPLVCAGNDYTNNILKEMNNAKNTI